MINQQGIISVNPAAATLGKVHGLENNNPYQDNETINKILRDCPESSIYSAVRFILAGKRRCSRRQSMRLAAMRLTATALIFSSALIIPTIPVGIATLLIICGVMMTVGIITRPAAGIAATVIAVAMAASGTISALATLTVAISIFVAITGAGRFSVDFRAMRAFKRNRQELLRRRRLSYAAYNYRF